jgi:uncharacterized cupredoxin-like copper-binding protein
MKFSNSRLLAVAALAGCVALLTAVPAFAGSGKSTGTTVKVTISSPNEFAFKLSTKSVKRGSVTFKFTNGGALPHDFKLCSSNKGGTANACAGKVTPLISGGATGTLTVNIAKPGKYEYMCTVPGHAASGMKGLLTVS